MGSICKAGPVWSLGMLQLRGNSVQAEGSLTLYSISMQMEL